MLLGILGASLLGNMLVGKGINRAEYDSKDFHSKRGKGIIRVGYGYKLDFRYHLILWLVLKYKNIIRMNPDLMEFTLKIIYLKKWRMGHI